MRTKEIVFNRFDGGKALDNRLALSNEFSKSLNFDIYSKPSLLIPVRAYEADQSYNGSSTGIKASDLACFGQGTGTSQVFAIGRKNDGTGRKIYNKTITGSEWTALDASDGSAAEASDGCAVPGFFVPQVTSNGSTLYWFVTGSSTTPSSGFWRLGLLDYNTSAAANFSKKTLAFNPTWNPQAILGKDGVVYISDNNKIHACNADTTVSSSVFTVSLSYRITSMCLYGNYLAIAIYGDGRSKVLLWDYNNAQAIETIEWGEGALVVLDNLDGVLVGVTDKHINSDIFGTSSGDGVMQIKTWAGGLQTLKEVKASGVVSGAVQQYKYVKNGILYWYAKIPMADGSYEEGLWGFGRTLSSQPYALSLHREIAGSSFEGFWGVSNYFYLPHSGDGSVSRTSDNEVYSLVSEYETPVINGEDSSLDKHALGITVSYQALESGQTLTLKYRKDGATNWTSLEPSPAIASGSLSAFYPISLTFREIEFKVQTNGGLIPSGLRFRYEELNNQLS